MKTDPISSSLYMMLAIPDMQMSPSKHALASLLSNALLNVLLNSLSACEHQVYKNIRELSINQSWNSKPSA